jgi:hypothetical protein
MPRFRVSKLALAFPEHHGSRWAGRNRVICEPCDLQAVHELVDEPNREIRDQAIKATRAPC